MIACICGGWIEILLISSGAICVGIWTALKRLCKKRGCDCECHKQ